MRVSLVITLALALCCAARKRPSDDDPDRCLQDLDPGPCEGLFYRWGFNRTSKQCEQFQYGGCLGNTNRFDSHKECKKICKRAVGKKKCSCVMS
ncbi:protease inhibitor-like [Oratosquilla oratoria]|uniref:protease inhibitor-like n=1 Tax=Oratosquilla oratoria TaxID=337810 RepID=UPI003F761343